MAASGEGRRRYEVGALRTWANRFLSGVNIVLLALLLAEFIGRGVVVGEPWNASALASIALTAATVVLAAVALGVALLAIWGYSTLRDHAAGIAGIAAKEAAERTAERMVREWLNTPADGGSEQIAQSYDKE